MAWGVAQAQSEPEIDGMPLSRYVSSPQYLERLHTYVIGYETWIGPCPDPEPVTREQTLLPQRSIALPGDPDPGAPQWIEIVSVAGCRNAYQRPVFVSVKGKKPLFHAVLMGSTKTSPAVQAEAVAALVEQERESAMKRGCQATAPVRVLTTAFQSSFQSEYGTGWRETWTIVDCAGVRNVPVRFAPDHTGGTAYTFSPSVAAP